MYSTCRPIQTLLITDAAINIYPDLSGVKRDIVQNAIDLAIALGTHWVAILYAVETVNPG
jgi:phosphotransacetylase